MIIDNNNTNSSEQSAVEKDPRVIIRDRAHHIEHMADMISDFLSIPQSPAMAAYNYASNIYGGRLQDVEYFYNQIEKLNYISESLDILLKIPWFNKLLKLIIQESFRIESEIMEWQAETTWNNIGLALQCVLSHITARVWVKHKKILLVEDDYVRIAELKHRKINVSGITDFVEVHKDEMRKLDVEIVNLLVISLRYIFESNTLRTELLPVIHMAPIYIKMVVDKLSYESITEIDYYRDLNVTTEVPNIYDTYQFKRMVAIVENVINAYLKEPDKLLELSAVPSGLCETAGNENAECGRHCLRHFNREGDKYFLEAIYEISIIYPELTQLFEFEFDDNGNISLVRLPVHLLGEKSLMDEIPNLRTSIANGYDIKHEQSGLEDDEIIDYDPEPVDIDIDIEI